ncbi:MAG: hypothetical protein NTY15_19650 [Planctomycetota bacterium]|nr:hypothetical protein [Planctomycetota bacterium]
MARDRNVYVWQAYVIVMSIVSVVCLGAMAFVIFSSGTSAKTVEGALEREQKAQTTLREESTRRQLLESMIGVGKPIPESEFQQMKTQITADDNLNAAIKTFQNNMELLGPSASERSYSKLATTLMAELRARNQQLLTSREKEQTQKDEFELKLAQETKAREAEKQNAMDLSVKLDKELVKYAEDIKTQQEKWDKEVAEKNKTFQTVQKKARDLEGRVEEQTKKNAELQKTLDGVVRKLEEIKGEDFQYAQGEITQVTNGGDLVWINLGKLNGLRPGVRFGVIDSNTSRVADAKPKARIEVIQSDDRLSRCRVLSDRAPTTILTGDKIYSPTWNPNQKTEIALVGKMDMNGDGTDDRETIKALIEQNGGVVTLDLPPGAVYKGKLSFDTRWMVMGEDFKRAPGAVDDPASDNAAAKARRELEADAKSKGISFINVDKLQGWLRASGETDVSPMGSAMRPNLDQFKDSRRSEGTGRVSEIFEKRNAIKP